MAGAMPPRPIWRAARKPRDSATASSVLNILGGIGITQIGLATVAPDKK